MSLSRFHLPPAAWAGPHLSLTGDEAAHCSRVMRKQPGDSIEIFDGRGRVAVCEITHVSKSEVQASITSETRVAPFQTAIHLLPALIKAEPFEWLLEKAVELGASSIQPVITERTVIHLDAAQTEKKLAKWYRHMIESAKQCHTPFVPELKAPAPFSKALSVSAGLKLIPALSEHIRTLKQALPEVKPATVAVLIGPEGDFTPDEEAQAFAAGFTPITLGPLILRAETAAIATLAILGHELR
ncbi:MAG: 16S rRNA (uracil(1498)-N(3))-methyltransferase [Prosthecobacter sp.]|jgi:16S rRNA (uracil1498-N3)-methyltransferase|uniref:16S rRNA (uracil(1498)-N(3))-methyltransferase n=1 Tax=Prosthecobacter sp. TaxID=1965333 RepID=UPI0019F10ECB|nr:16S rRNA (uracil(1498)-N(3))-methyltransferase [Prosthecobacter sp.]MBE2286689.1 16S rRNA (uracil(1498)-N(3))-methyltransferase [Prosthecobacter sp.]